MLKMISESKNAGCEVIKFQHHLRDKEMVKGLNMSKNFNEDLYDFGRCSLNIQQHILLKNECERLGIKYLCTPFCKEAAQELIENKLCETMKIGSGEMQDFRLLDFLTKEGINLILSTGMSTLKEIDETINSLRKEMPLLHLCIVYQNILQFIMM